MVGMTSAVPLTFSVWIAGIVSRWSLILRVMASIVVIAALLAVILPPVYEARASFVTTSSSGKMNSALTSGAGLQGIASQFGVGSMGEPSESPNFYVKLIESEELRRRLLRSKFRNPDSRNLNDSVSLLNLFRIRNSDPERQIEIGMKKLERDVAPDFDLKTNLVYLKVTSRWSDVAADMANRIILLVDEFNHEQRVSRARSKRVFLQNRLDSAQAALRLAEEKQRSFYEQNRLWRNAPQLVFEENRLRRDSETASDLFLTLQRQFEAARLDEFNDAAVITVVDHAVPPHKAQWPRYWILLASALAIGAMLGALVAGAATILEDWRRRNPSKAQALRASIDGLPTIRRRQQHTS